MSSPDNPVNTIAAPPIDPPSPDAAAATTSSSAGTSGDVSTAKASQPASQPPSPASRSPLSSSPATTGGVARGDSTETRTEQQPDGEEDANDIMAAAPHTHASHAPASAPASQPASLPAPPRPMPFGKRVVRCGGGDFESSVDAASGPLSGPQTPQGSTSAGLVAGGLTQPTAGAPVMVAGVPSLSGLAAATAQQGRGPATTAAAGQATGVLKSLPVFPPRVFRSVGTASSPPAPSSTPSLAAAAPRFVTPPTPARLSIPMPAMRHMSTPLSSPTIGPSTAAAVLHMATSPVTPSGVVTMGGLGGGTPSSVFARGGSRRRNSISVPTSPFNEDGGGDGNENTFADDVAGGDGYGGSHQPPPQQQRGAGGRGTERWLVDSQRRVSAAAAVPFVAVKSEPASGSGPAPPSPTPQTARSSATAAAAAAATAASNAASVVTAPEQSSSSTSVSHQAHVQTPHAPPPPPPPPPPAPLANTNVNGTAVQRTGSANAARAGTLSASTDRLRTSLVIGPPPSPLVSPDAGSVVCGAPGGSLSSAHRGGGGVTGTSMSRRDSPSSSLRFTAHDPYNMSAMVATPLTANVHRTTSLTSYRSPSAAATPTGAGFMHLRTWSPSTLLTMHGVGSASGAAPASSTGADRPVNPGESGTSFSYYANANSDSISVRSSAVDASRGAHEGVGLWAYGATPSRLPSPSTADQFLYDSQPPFEDYAAPHTARYAGDATPRQAGAAHAAALAPADSADDSWSEADELAYEAEEAPMQTQAQPRQHEHSSSDDAAFERTQREERGGGHAERQQQQPRTPRMELPACLPHDDAPQEGTDEYAGGYVPPAMPRYAAPQPNARPPPPPRSRSGEPAITAAAAYWPPYGSADHAYAPPAQRNGYAPTPTSSYQQPQQQRYPDPRGAAASVAGLYPPPVANAAPPYPDPSQGPPRPHQAYAPAPPQLQQAYPAQRGRGGSAGSAAGAGAGQQRKRTAQHALPGFFSIEQVELGDQTHLTADRHGVLHDHHEEASPTPNSQPQAHGEEAGVRSGSAAEGYTPLPSPPHHSARPYDRYGGDTVPVPPASPSCAVYYDVAASGGAARGGAGAVGGSRTGAESAATVTGTSPSLYGSDDDELARLPGGGSGMGSGGYALASMRPMTRGALAGGGAAAQLPWLSGPRGGYAGGGAPRSRSAGASHQAILSHANLGGALVNEMANGRGNGGVGETAAAAAGPASHNIDGFANVSSSTLSGPLPPPMPHIRQQQQPAPGMNGGHATNNAFPMRSSALYGAVPAPPPHEYPQQQQHLHASPPLGGPVQTRFSSCSHAAHDAQSDFRGSSTSSTAPISPPLPRSAAAHQRLVPSNAPISDMRPLPNSVKQSPAATYNATNSNTSSSSGGDAAKDAYATQAGVGCSSSDINPPSQRQVTMATLNHLHAGGSGGEGSRSAGTAPYPQQQEQQHLQQPSNLSHAYHSQPYQQQQQYAGQQLTYRLSGRGRGGGGAMLTATGHRPCPSDGSLMDPYDGAEAGAMAALPIMMQRHRGVR